MDDFDKPIRDQYYEGVNGSPVQTQLEEVQRLRQVVQAKIDEKQDASKANELARVLLPLTRDSDRRLELRMR